MEPSSGVAPVAAATAGSDAPAALSVRGLTVDYPGIDGDIHAVRGVDIEVPAGEIVALLGESGSGKSVTARAVLGLDDAATVDAERMTVGTTNLLTLGSKELRRARGRDIGLVMQDALSALNPVLSIGNQLGEVLRTHLKLSRSEARKRSVELLAQVGISDPERRVKEYPHQFSGGMRQRILIAMAIALEPPLLIADEPTTALDVTVQAQILELIDRLRQEHGIGVLLITHDLGVVNEVTDRLAVMYAGRIVERGRTADVLAHPAHPYTQALLRSVPEAATVGRELLTIPGSPPSPGQVPSGCAFRNRCDWAIDLCAEERPLLLEIHGDRAITSGDRAREERPRRDPGTFTTTPNFDDRATEERGSRDPIHDRPGFPTTDLATTPRDRAATSGDQASEERARRDPGTSMPAPTHNFDDRASEERASRDPIPDRPGSPATGLAPSLGDRASEERARRDPDTSTTEYSGDRASDEGARRDPGTSTIAPPPTFDDRATEERASRDPIPERPGPADLPLSDVRAAACHRSDEVLHVGV